MSRTKEGAEFDGQIALLSPQEVYFSSEPGRPGAAVNIAERAEALGHLLSMLNEDNRAAGLQHASTTDPHRRKLAIRYDGKVDQVVNGASKKAAGRELAEKYEFSRAFGQNSLYSSGFDADEIKQETREEYLKFLNEYGVGRADAAKRNKEAKRIQKSARIITGKSFS